MSETSRGLDISAEQKDAGPDYFGFYACEVAALLSQEEDFLPFSHQASDAGIKDELVGRKTVKKDSDNLTEKNSAGGSAPLFSNSLGTWIPESMKERLKSLLQQSVSALSQEVDEMLDSVFSMCRIQAVLRYKKSLPKNMNTASQPDNDQPPQKKIRLSTSSSDSETKKMDKTVPGKEMPDAVMEKCSVCFATEISETLCKACGSKVDQQREPIPINSDIGAEEGNGEENDDLQFLLESDCSVVEHILEKYTNELMTTIKHMENMLDKLLDVVMLNCRSMSRTERQELMKLIQKLPAKNLDRVVEIIQRSRPVGKISSGEIHVDLEKEDKVTLWRLYYYVQAVESAWKLHKSHSRVVH